MTLGHVGEQIRHKLTESFAPAEVSVRDESWKHAGHAGARPEGETHFHVTVVADAFRGLSRLERHRRVNAVLAEELRGRVHALAISALVPGEAHASS